MVCVAAQADDNVTAERNLAAGQEQLERGEYLGALKSLGKSAHDGNSEAQYLIGKIFLEGKGMKANPEDAAYWFRKAAQNGHAPSQLAIAHCFMDGIGVQQDSRIAAEWFWRAAEQGNAEAAFYLARMYRDGKGMKQDLTKARKYYRLAASAGNEAAKSELDALPASKSDKKATKRGGKTSGKRHSARK